MNDLNLTETFKSLFKKDEKDLFLYIREGKIGVETFINPNIKNLNRAYRLQVISFLNGVLAELEERGNKNAGNKL